MHTSEYFFIQHVFIVLKVEYRFMWDKKDQYCKKFFSLKFKPINIEFVVKGSIVISFTGVCSKIIYSLQFPAPFDKIKGYTVFWK